MFEYRPLAENSHRTDAGMNETEQLNSEAIERIELKQRLDLPYEALDLAISAPEPIR